MRDKVVVRLAKRDDAEALGRLYERNLSLFSSDEPSRDASFFTVEGQARALRDALDEYDAGRQWPGVALMDGDVIGKITLHDIRRGPLNMAEVGGWLSADLHNHGVATDALAHLLRIAFGELGLHKIVGYAKVDNIASRKVMEHNGFSLVGTVERHVYDRGRWHDEMLYERLAPWCDGTRPSADG